jgi:D-alanyl-D-alanine carboxypeptidase
MMTRRAVVALAFVFAAVAALTAVVAADRQPSSEKQLASLLEGVVAAGAPGVMALVEDESVTRRGASGLADRASGKPMRATDRFRIGSITKTFVAAVVLQLAAEGRLGLDAPVERWLPGLVPRGITVRQLLAHTSGLFDYVNDSRAFAGEVSEPRRLVALALSHPLLGRPGERYAYASTNYVVLGLLVERVSGTSLEKQLAQRIFRPLRLTRTTFEPGTASELRIRGYRAPTRSGIIIGEREDTTGETASWAWAAGAIVSDADDVASFFRALLGGRLVPKPLLRQMVPERDYGLGLAAFRTPCGTAVGHTGNLLGYVSAAWSTPDGNRRVVMMANTYPLGGEAERAFHRTLDAAFCG